LPDTLPQTSSPQGDATRVIPLEGGLLRSRLRQEQFWQAFGQGWTGPLTTLAALARGRQALRDHLDRHSTLDPATLPYDPDVVADLGRPDAPVTLSAKYPKGIARQIADHHGIATIIEGKAAPQATPRKRDVLRALRPHQWLKNLLVFLPMLAAHQLDAATFAAALLAFVSFSLVASSVYVLNDLLDLAADRAHPRKCNRPFASGAVPLSYGSVLAPALLIAGGAVAAPLGPTFIAVLAIYYGATMLYSFSLKRHMVIDICMLAGLYIMRMIAGSTATKIPLSVWLLAFALFIFLSLAAVKRQAELVDAAGRGALASSGRGYQVADLPIISMIALCSGYVSVLVMALYVNSPNVVELYAQPAALWAVCAVLLYWITRTVLLTHRGQMHDDPVVFALRDRISQICFAVIAGCVLIGALL
jgi:4-hydroxybenzoate polyprenyltransferase